MREVDIVIRVIVSGYELIISVECTDKGRPASVEWVEQSCSKHQDLPTQKLVLVSKSGFTKAAFSKALSMGAEPISLEDAKRVDWTKYVGRYSKLFFASINAVTVVIPVSSTFLPDDFRNGIPMKTRVLSPDGKFRATAEEISNAALSKKQIFDSTIGKMDKTIGRVIPGKDTDVYIKGNFEYTVAHELVLSQDDELCVHPLFSGIFGGGKNERPVYPYGSVLDDEDYRNNDD